MTARIGYLVSHPIQYYTPIFRELARQCDLTVYFAHRQTASGQAEAGFGVAFEWDVDLLSGYESRFLANAARHPSTDRFFGCSTPGIGDEIERGRFDAFIVPGWALQSYWQAVRACRRAGVPVLVRGDSQLRSRRQGAIQLAKAAVFPRVLRLFDGFLYVGQRNREYLLHYGVSEDRLFFAPHCIDNDTFATASAQARATTPVTGPRPVRQLLFVGKLLDSKRPVDLLEAAGRIFGQAVEVVFVGAGPAEEALREIAARLGVRARFLGFCNQSALPAVYAAADLLVLPSVETWGLVVNEAMACGIPAVVSDAVGCGPDLIEEGKTGAVFPLGNVELLARAIETVLGFSPETTAGHLARKMKVYSPATCATAILAAAATLG